MSPDSDQKIHGYQHQFPEEIEKKKIKRKKYSDNTGQYNEQIEMKEANL